MLTNPEDLAFNMTLAEFLDFDELNNYSFADNEDD